MFPRLLPIIIASAAGALAAGALAAGWATREPRLWAAALALVVLSGISPTIVAVNVRIVPVFSRRGWQSPRMLAGALLALLASGWLVFAGRAVEITAIQTLGQLSALAGGVLFVASLARLFRSPVVAKVAPPLPYPEHAAIDSVGVRFTRAAGSYLLLGLLLGVALRFWTPDRGRWDLVWAHTLLLGWMLMMVSGVSYHVLARWTGHRWRTPRLIRLHLLTTQIATPLMLLALAIGQEPLFAAAGVLQAVALSLFAVNVLPMTLGLPMTTRAAFTGAVAFLLTGVTLGALFALDLDPLFAARLRIAHGVINLFGFTSLMIAGAGYYLFPRFAGNPLRWPRLALAQLATQVTGVALLASGWAAWGYGHAIGETLAVTGGTALAASLATFAAIAGATFRRRARGVVAPVTIGRPAINRS